MLQLNLESVCEYARNDFEFTREMRFFSGSICIQIGQKANAMFFENGKFLELKEVENGDDCTIVISGDESIWEEMLKKVPRPFYQCLQTTQVKHGLYITTNTITYAYLPALNRLLQIMKMIVNGGEN